jgi:predicted ABC-type ATPase
VHERLLEQARAEAPNLEQQRRAIVLAGPPGAGTSTVLDDVPGGDHRGQYLVIDADEFTRYLLHEAMADGSYDTWLLPKEIRAHQEQGEQFYPLELASLVHEESAYLAKALRADAIEASDNIVIDTVLSNETDALRLGQTLHAAGYDVQVVDVEVPYELSAQRIRSRWQHAYTTALAGGDPLGGRWVPSEYARDVFDGPGGQSRPEAAARALAEQCPAVSRYQVFRTTMEHAQKQHTSPTVDVDKSRSASGAALVDTTQQR